MLDVPSMISQAEGGFREEPLAGRDVQTKPGSKGILPIPEKSPGFLRPSFGLGGMLFARLEGKGAVLRRP